MNIYLETELNFNNNGLGFLTDCLDALVTEELNGDYSLTFTYPINSSMSKYLISGNIVKCNVGNSNYQLFRIIFTDKNFSTITVTAKHIFYDLLTNFIEDSSPMNLDPSSLCSWILNRTTYKNKFSAFSDISKTASARYVRKNPVECILGDIENSIINIFNAEIERDNFLIKLLKRRGSNNHVKLVFAKNITSINISTDITSIYTKIMPIGYDGLLLPEKYVDSPLINNYPTPKIIKYKFSDIRYDPEDENSYHTLDDAYNALRKATNDLYDSGIDKPSVNIKIDWLELSKTKEYSQYSVLESINLGDTIYAEIFGLNYETRVIKTQYNPLLDRIVNFEIGTPKASFQNTINNISSSIDNVNVDDILKQAKDNATNLLTSAMGGYVYKTNNELFIMDTNTPETCKKVWRWNLNGLGYSSTGINGSYETAITQDGHIVADFIGAGKINTNLIEGYNSLVQSVKDVVDVSLSASGVGNANIINSSKGLLHKIEIFGNLELQDNSEDNNSDFKITITKESDIQEYIVEDMKNLYQIGDVHDSFIYEDGSISIIHRIGINDDNTTYVLDEYTTENLKGFDINVPGGNYTISINHQLNINVEYLKENIYTNTFATRAGVSNQIQITKDGILIESKKYTDGQFENGDNLISSINTKSSGEILIDASKLAEINANKINFNSYDFNVTTKNMKISIGEGDNKKDLINSNGVLTNLIYPGYINGSMFVGSGDYIPLGRVGGGDTADTQRNKCTFAFKLPTNYVVQSAKIYLSHAPTAFTYNYGQSSINGYSRNLKLYKGNPAYLKMHFNIDASMSYTENASYYEISNALNFTGNPNVATSCQSIDIKNYIDTDKENLLAIYDSDASVYQSNEEILGRTGSVFAYLEIIGYSKI